MGKVGSVAAKAERGETDESFGGVEPEGDASQDAELGVGRLDEALNRPSRIAAPICGRFRQILRPSHVIPRSITRHRRRRSPRSRTHRRTRHRGQRRQQEPRAGNGVSALDEPQRTHGTNAAAIN